MFDIPGLDMISPLIGAVSPAAEAFGTGMSAGGAIADAAGSAWDFASGAVSNLGALDPSLIGGPFMPSFGGGADAAGGQVAQPLPLGLIDDRDISSVSGELAPYEQDWLY